jgi:arabinose-5-phosphate isomerase
MTPTDLCVPAFQPERAIRLAQETLDIEAAAIQGLKAKLDISFARVVEMMLRVSGRVVVMGMGKSGHIGRKIAATLASTGTPAMFVHPAEASHGDLGMIRAADLVLAISNSGESAEMTAVLPMLKRMGAPLIAMTGNAESTLARYADVFLNSGVEKEACPLNLEANGQYHGAIGAG